MVFAFLIKKNNTFCHSACHLKSQKESKGLKKKRELNKSQRTALLPTLAIAPQKETLVTM